MIEDYSFGSPRTPTAIGDRYGNLTVVEFLSGGRVRCSCACGASDIIRNLANLRDCQVSAQSPQCKKCMRVSRKRKNPGGGATPLRRSL